MVRLSLALVGLACFASPAAASKRPTAPLPRGSITIVYAPCPALADAEGCVLVEQPDTIYLANRDRATREHELGHIFDARQLDDGERNAIKRRLHKTAMPWCDVDAFLALKDQDPSNTPPCEDFAEAYANCRMHMRPGDDGWTFAYGYDPNRREHRRMCALIRRAAD